MTNKLNNPQFFIDIIKTKPVKRNSKPKKMQPVNDDYVEKQFVEWLRATGAPEKIIKDEENRNLEL